MRLPLLLLMVARSAQAQMPQVGDTVKVWAVSPSLDGARGTVKRVGGDTVLFNVRSAVSREWLDTPVETRSITRIEVRDGFRRSRTRMAVGYSIGAVLGLAAGGYIAWRMSPLYCNTTPCPPSTLDANEVVFHSFGVLVGGVGGAAVGGGIGWAIGRRPVSRWRQVYP